MIEVWKATNDRETVETFRWWEKDKALSLAQGWSVGTVKVYVFEDDKEIWTNQ